jgi:hypothetical protein
MADGNEKDLALREFLLSSGVHCGEYQPLIELTMGYTDH